MTIEDSIVNEINEKWVLHNKGKKDMTNEIVDEYVDILCFYDSLYPNVKNDEITHYNICKTIIITNLRDELIDEIKGSEYLNKVLDKYNKIYSNSIRDAKKDEEIH